jgi:hypothetical protein
MLRQGLGNIGGLKGWNRPDFRIDEPENAYFLWGPQFDLGVRKLCANGNQRIGAAGLQAATTESAGVFDEKKLIRNFLADLQKPLPIRVYANDAARKQVRECE